MDRYDAILEHLKKAQARGLDSVSNSLESVVAGLDELITTAKSTVQNATPENLEDAFPIGEAAAAIKELCEKAAAPSGVSLELLRTLDRTRNQSELLRELLPMLAQFVGRAVVLVIRDNSVSAWSGIGFADGEKLRSWKGDVATSPALRNIVDDTVPLEFDPAGDRLFSEWLTNDRLPEDAVLFPFCLRGKLMGTMYVDHYGHEKWDVESAQSLVAIACWLIDTLHHRQTVPSPIVAEIKHFELETERIPVGQEPIKDEPFAQKPELGPAVAEPPAAKSEMADVSPELEQVDAPSFELEEESGSPASVDVAEVSVDQPASGEVDFGIPEEFAPPAVVESAAEAQAAEPVVPTPAEQGLPPDFDPSATMRVDVSQMIGTPAVQEQRPPDPIPEAPPQFEERPAPPPVEPVQPPDEPASPPPVEESGSQQLSAEDEARHQEAKRFARLLVSEIKLYNEDEVERGRASNDLYKRLQEDIDRSREMYEKRIPEDIRAGSDYFHEEIVRILADGNDSALGM